MDSKNLFSFASSHNISEKTTMGEVVVFRGTDGLNVIVNLLKIELYQLSSNAQFFVTKIIEKRQVEELL